MWFVVTIVVMAVLIAEAMVGFSNTGADLGTGHTDKVERLQECLVPAVELVQAPGRVPE